MTLHQKKLKKRNKIQRTKDGSVIYQQGDTARGSLHQDTFYGAILTKNEKNDENIKYVVRKELSKLKETDVAKIVDKTVRGKVEAAVKEKGLNNRKVKQAITDNTAKA